MQQAARLLLTKLRILREVLDDLVFTEEVPGNHSKNQPAAVADIFSGAERINQVRHHGLGPKLFDRHVRSPASKAREVRLSFRLTFACVLHPYLPAKSIIEVYDKRDRVCAGSVGNSSRGQHGSCFLPAG